MGTLRDLQFALQLKIEELRQRDTLIDELELELDTKDELIRRLQEELDRYRATVSLPGPSAVTAGNMRAKRKTIICEPVAPDPVTLTAISHTSCDKSPESQRLIQAAFLKNDLLKNLDSGQIRAIMACMYATTISMGCCVIQEGTTGALAYVLEEGKLDVTKDGQRLLTVEPESVFGELALYNCTHPCTISALTDSKLWVIDRRSFQTRRTGWNTQFSSWRSFHLPFFYIFSAACPCISHFCFVPQTHYSEGDYIIRQGATGDTFYIISKGQVKVTEKTPGHEEPVVLSKENNVL
uniref:Cyclic nucleotide-binding domain-containing protein n=1 Tax=Myripristis murdjan TaxID=586833 RepID=A0A668ANB3_9TELE